MAHLLLCRRRRRQARYGRVNLGELCCVYRHDGLRDEFRRNFEILLGMKMIERLSDEDALGTR